MAATATKERPIACHQHEVRGILDGRQTMLRRVVKTIPEVHKAVRTAEHVAGATWKLRGDNGTWMDVTCPFGGPGSVLWVQETWQRLSNGGPAERDFDGIRDDVFYRADESDPAAVPLSGKWRPSTTMPRWASRLTLELTEVRVERDGEWCWCMSFVRCP